MNNWSHWSSDGPGSANLRKVCTETVESFEREFRRSPGAADYLASAASARDVKAAIEELVSNSGTLPRDKKAVPKSAMPPRHVVTRLHLFSDQVENFARILDVLAIVSGRTVSVVWEAAIFVLKIFSRNSAILFSKSETLYRDVCCQKCITLAEWCHVAGLGRHLISVFQRTIQWCNFQRSGYHLFSILKPFKLYDESILKKIHASSKSIDDEERLLLSMRLVHNSNQMSDLEIRQFKLAAHLPLQVDSLYKPLASGKYEIRLLALEPAKAESSPSLKAPESARSNLHWALHTVALDDAPSYTALPYHWGDQNQTVPIIVNNIEIRITSTLHAALMSLRMRAKEVIYVWVDSLCINQQNLEERSRQVERMEAIYREAADVAVWLGPAENADDLIKTSDISYDQQNYPSNVKAIRQLLSRPYWRRVWVIQEVAVASSVRIYYGPYTIAWDDFITLCGTVFIDNDRLATRPEDDLLSGLTTLREFRRDILSPRPISMLEALQRSRCSISTEPRDKLYALLGLVFDGKTFITEPNCRSSVGKCFTRFTTALIKHRGPLDFIYLRSANRTTQGDLPSWVPDWTDLGDTVASRQLQYIRDCVSLCSEKEVPRIEQKDTRVEVSEAELTVSGVLVDTIDDIGSNFFPNRGNQEDIKDVTAEEAFQAQLPQKLKDVIPKAFVKPLGTWLAENHAFINNECPIGVWQTLLHKKSMIIAENQTKRSIFDPMKSQMRPFKASRGHFGWAHPQAQKGNKIFKIAGCNQLVILRNVRNGYVVVGDAMLSDAAQVELFEDGQITAAGKSSISTGKLSDGIGKLSSSMISASKSEAIREERLVIF